MQQKYLPTFSAILIIITFNLKKTVVASFGATFGKNWENFVLPHMVTTPIKYDSSMEIFSRRRLLINVSANCQMNLTDTLHGLFRMFRYFINATASAYMFGPPRLEHCNIPQMQVTAYKHSQFHVKWTQLHLLGTELLRMRCCRFTRYVPRSTKSQTVSQLLNKSMQADNLFLKSSNV